MVIFHRMQKSHAWLSFKSALSSSVTCSKNSTRLSVIRESVRAVVTSCFIASISSGSSLGQSVMFWRHGQTDCCVLVEFLWSCVCVFSSSTYSHSHVSWALSQHLFRSVSPRPSFLLYSSSLLERWPPVCCQTRSRLWVSSSFSSFSKASADYLGLSRIISCVNVTLSYLVTVPRCSYFNLD